MHRLVESSFAVYPRNAEERSLARCIYKEDSAGPISCFLLSRLPHSGFCEMSEVFLVYPRNAEERSLARCIYKEIALVRYHASVYRVFLIQVFEK